MAEYANAERKMLLDTAKASIDYYLHNHKLPPVNLNDYPEQLRQNRGCFVSLHLNGQLRGCIGTLAARQPLIADVVQNAYNAAFQDPRFSPLSVQEFAQVHIEISVLSTPQKMHFTSEQDLLRQIRPGIDGLILSDNGRRGTFLPVVWEQLPDPVEFLAHLKM